MWPLVDVSRVLNPASKQETLEEGPSPVEPSDSVQPGSTVRDSEAEDPHKLHL